MTYAFRINPAGTVRAIDDSLGTVISSIGFLAGLSAMAAGAYLSFSAFRNKDYANLALYGLITAATFMTFTATRYFITNQTGPLRSARIIGF